MPAAGLRQESELPMFHWTNMTRLTILAAVIALATAAAPVSAADRVRTGQWEVTTTSNGKARTFKNCVSTAEAAAANGDAKTGRAYVEKMLPGQCKFTDYKVEGNSVSSVMTCDKTTVRSTTTYHGDSYQSESKTTTGGAPEVVSHISAKRIGDCP
jgi:hypothetical protein